jgi:hypothetical protein
MVIPSFCVIKLYFLGNYCGMAVNYCSILTPKKIGVELPQYFTAVLFYNNKKYHNIDPWCQVVIPHNFNPKKCNTVSVINYDGIFRSLAPGPNVIKHFTAITYECS